MTLKEAAMIERHHVREFMMNRLEGIHAEGIDPEAFAVALLSEAGPHPTGEGWVGSLGPIGGEPGGHLSYAKRLQLRATK